MDTLQEQKLRGKQDHTVRYIIYAAAAYFGLQYLFKPKQSRAAVLILQPAKGMVAADTSSAPSPAQVVLKMGSVGADVYQLQKWLGFKDRNKAQRNEFIADSHFGRQTEFALLHKTGKRTISVPELRQRLGQPAYS